MKPIGLKYKNNVLSGNIQLTGSKAISNRILMMSALSDSVTEFNNISLSEDTQLLKFYLAFFDTCANSRIAMIVDARNASAVMRFIMAYAAIMEGKWLITGHERLKEQSIKPLVDALRNLGAEIIYTEKEGTPPVKIIGKNLTGGEVVIDSMQSSHFVSALMLIAPYLYYGLTINLKGKPVSRSYILMTANLMQQSGIDIEMDEDSIKIQPGNYNLKPQDIESDWYNASFWYELTALSDNAEFFIEGLKKESVQGESILAEIYKNFGVETTFAKEGIKLTKTNRVVKEFSYDFTDFPDLALPVIVTCAALKIKSTFKGLNRDRIKESTRIESLENELQKLGAVLRQEKNTFHLDFNGDESFSELNLDADNDHKLAMSFAPLAVKADILNIYNPGTVKKSYPGFWKDIKNAGMEINIPEGICS